MSELMKDLLNVVDAPCIDWWNETVRRLKGVPKGWRQFSLRAHMTPEQTVEVWGAVPIGVVTRGEMKGWPKWPKKSLCDRFLIPNAEMRETQRLYELETGNCFECEGTCRQWYGWSKAEGQLYRACVRCGATGKATKEALSA